MQVISVTGGLATTNAYAILDESAKIAIIIDTPRDTFARMLPALRKAGVTVPYLLLTHGHWDHIGDHAEVTAAFPEAKVLISKIEEPRLQNPSGMSFQLPYTIPPRNADGTIEDNQEITAGDITLKAIFTPGHAAGHMALHSAAHKILFVGDLLMADRVGRYDLPDSNFSDLKASLRRVVALPEETTVLSGHGPATTIGREIQFNPFVRGHQLAPARG